MTDLSVFNEGGKTTDLSVFAEAPVEKSVKSEASDRQVAIQGTLLGVSMEGAGESLDQLQDMDEETRANTLSVITDGVRQETTKLTSDIAADMILNPELSEEDRELIVLSASGLSQEKPSSTDLLSLEMGSKPSGDEGAEAEDIRLDAAAISASVNKRLELKQSILNGEALSGNSGAWNAIGDFLDIVVPLSESFLTAGTISKIRNGDKSAMLEAFTLLGNSKAGLKEYYKGLPAKDQDKFIRSLAEMVNASSTIIFTNDNDLAQRDLFMSIVDGDYYGEGDQFLDNVISVLDLVGLGGLLRGPQLVAKMASLANRVRRRKMVSGTQPTSPINVVKEVNPEEARKLHAAAVADETGEAAEALHGTTREEAIVGSQGPQVATEGGEVENKVHAIDKYVDELVKGEGFIDLSAEELLSAQKLQASRLEKVNGITNRREMAVAPEYKDNGNTVYHNVYGKSDSAYADPEHALEDVLFNLRDYGVEEGDLTLLQKVGDGYVPVSLSEVKANKDLRETFVKSKKAMPEELRRENFKEDFLVQANFEQPFDQMDISFDTLQVKRNWFDHIPAFNKGEKGKSSINRMLVDAHSMFDPRITLGANVAVERGSAIETALIQKAEQFSTPFNRLPGVRQRLLQDIIQNQNFSGKLLSPAQLRAKGVTGDERKILDSWKETWDTVYWLENRDLNKSLNAGGYKLYVDEIGDSQLVAKPLAKQSTGNVGQVFDPTTGELRRITQDELEALYESGGTVAKLRQTEELDGKAFDYVLSHNVDKQSSLRDIKSTDQVLKYREGYYTVRYKQPHIIEKQWVDPDTGRVTRTQALKTAPDIKAADLSANNLNRANREDGVRYIARSNRDDSVTKMEDDYWSIQATNGRTSQRLRGERLGEASPTIASDSLGATEGPVEALLNSVRSISRRTSMRGYLERYKARFMDEYGDMLPLDDYGKPVWPRTAADLKPSSRDSGGKVSDARSNLEYINYLENGYRNSLDDTWKAMMNGLADALGKYSATGERLVRATSEEISSPTTFFKARAFDAYLALNPLRQFVVQGHQATLLTANFTEYVLTQRLAQDMTALNLAIIMGKNLGKVKGVESLMGRSVEDAMELLAQYKRTGFEASIDRNNLVEKGLDQLIETTRFKTAKKVHKAIVGSARKIGFDAGERVNIMSSWLAHRDRALKEGKDITSPRVFDEVTAKARNYTFNMNAAGDMPYNKNSLSLLFQFMQVPHKAMLQLTNRALSRSERAKLATYNLVMLPLPVGMVTTILGDSLPEDPTARDVVINGVEGAIVNKIAREMYGDDTSIDFSSLAAVDPDAPWELVHGLLTLDIVEIFMNSPSLSLWAGHNPRVTNIIREVGKFISPPEGDTREVGALLHTFGQYSSGYANFSKSYKALAVQKYARTYSSTGQISGTDVTTPEMIALAFGFRSLEEALNTVVKGELYNASKAARDDVKEVYRLQTQSLARRGVNVDNPEYSTEMMRAFWLATDFREDQKSEYLRLINKDVAKGETAVLGMIVNNLNLVKPEDLDRAISMSGNKEALEETMKLLRRTGEKGE